MRRQPKERFYLSDAEEALLYKIALICFPFIVFIIFAIVTWFIPNTTQSECAFWYFWGIYCPGCGGTRAVIALFEGRILESLWYHPFVLYCVIIYLAYIITHSLNRIGIRRIKGLRFRIGFLYGAVAILILNCILKNMLNVIWEITM